MTIFIQSFLLALKPAFSYQATFQWFVIAFAGLILRHDCLGLTSIIRALFLPIACYPGLIHFFHSSAWSPSSLVTYWTRWVHQQHLAVKDSGRIVLIGDHTKTPKDGRCIPAVTTLHQDSETAGKPSFFRGHEWGCIAMLMAAGSKIFATPLSARIHNDSIESGSRIQRLVAMAGHATEQMQTHAYLVLDAFFSVGSTFEEADRWNGRIHILTRAKKNITAYIPAETCRERKPGRPRIYGPKLKLMDLFDQWKTMFLSDTLPVYGKQEIVPWLILDLMWKPTKGMIRFFLIETSRGRMILMTSDLTRRENNPSRSRPIRQKPKRHYLLIEKFVTLHLVLIGFLQIIALRFPNQIRQKALCWLRTDRSEIPSEFVTKTALANLIRSNLDTSGDDLITHYIQNKRKNIENTGLRRKVA